MLFRLSRSFSALLLAPVVCCGADFTWVANPNIYSALDSNAYVELVPPPGSPPVEDDDHDLTSWNTGAPRTDVNFALSDRQTAAGSRAYAIHLTAVEFDANTNTISAHSREHTYVDLENPDQEAWSFALMDALQSCQVTPTFTSTKWNLKGFLKVESHSLIAQDADDPDTCECAVAVSKSWLRVKHRADDNHWEASWSLQVPVSPDYPLGVAAGSLSFPAWLEFRLTPIATEKRTDTDPFYAATKSEAMNGILVKWPVAPLSSEASLGAEVTISR